MLSNAELQGPTPGRKNYIEVSTASITTSFLSVSSTPKDELAD